MYLDRFNRKLKHYDWKRILGSSGREDIIFSIQSCSSDTQEPLNGKLFKVVLEHLEREFGITHIFKNLRKRYTSLLLHFEVYKSLLEQKNRKNSAFLIE